MNTIQTVAPTQEPLTIEEAITQCNLQGIASSDDEAMLALYITAARKWVENLTGRAIALATYKTTLDAFPPSPYARGYQSCDQTIYLPMPPLVSLLSIYYRDGNGSLVPLNSSNYRVDSVSQSSVSPHSPVPDGPSTSPSLSAMTWTGPGTPSRSPYRPGTAFISSTTGAATRI